MQCATQVSALFITHVEKEGPFLKIWGQHDKLTSKYIHDVLCNYFLSYDHEAPKPRPEELQTGMLCIAKYRDHKFYRVRITNLDFITNRYISANFIDLGFIDLIPTNAIRSIDKFDSDFISLIPQAQSFLLACAVCPRGEWNEAALNEISEEIKFKDVKYTVVANIANQYIARIFFGTVDLTESLISKTLMRHTSLTTQEAVLLSVAEKAHTMQSQNQQNIATYKTFTLEPGNQYPIYVSYITDGPCNFSIQLKQSEEALCKLMKEINSMTLTPLESVPIPGTVCLARCVEDGHICRAVVTNEVDGHFKVFYVDFGNFEVVSYDELFDIPFKYVIPKVMSLRFSLAGIEKSSVTLDMQCAFKNFVDNRLIYMKVLPMTTRTALQKCELWDPVTKINALDVMNEAAGATYPEPLLLTRGFSQMAKVSYVFSCSRLYIQLKSKETELTNLMTDIQAIIKEPIDPDKIKPGLPCLALYTGDNHWYRSQIVEVLGDQLKIQYVDYGNEEIVSTNLICAIDGKYLVILRPQAIECCLNGYQNMASDEQRDHLLEELILEQEFTMKVIEMQGTKALIELIDRENYNVASLLLEKIALSRAQISPVLVQGGSKIEHRKLNNDSTNTKRNDYRNKRDSSDSTTSPKNDWREEGTNKFRNRNTNENCDANQNSWRQNNKGFRKHNTSTESESSPAPPNKNLFNRNFKDKNQGADSGGEDNFNRPQKDFSKRRDNFGGNDWNNRDSKGSDWNNKESKGGDWNNRESRGGGGNWNNRDSKSGDWNNRESKGGGEWNNRDSRSGDRNNRDHRGGDRGKREFRGGGDRGNRESKGDDWSRESKADDWNQDSKGDSNWNRDSKPSFNKDRGFRKDNFNRNRDGKTDDFKSDRKFSSGFKREGSSSGSEKSFRKNYNKNKTGGSNFRKNDYKTESNWNKHDSSPKVVEDIITTITKFRIQEVDGLETNVSVSWFHNPSHFYCQLVSSQDEFRKMMEDIQIAYKNREPGNCSLGVPVIGLFSEDSVLYRARIIEKIGMQYKLHYVDFGNVSLTDKVWPIEDRFMELPEQAICCSLNGVELPPQSESWPDVNVYSEYFNKSQFTCRFVSKLEDKNFVDLYADDQNIMDLLLNSGLVSQLQPPMPIETNLLLNQQFRAQLLSVNNLEDFILLLQNGTPLSCSIHNLKNATETFENILKENLHQILIVYVDDIIDNKFDVTLYDGNGNLLELIQPNEEAFKTVDIMCPYLISYSQISGVVSYIKENIVYIQPNDCSEIIEYLLNRLYEYYNELTVEEEIAPEVEFYYAVQSSDTNWYRGRVISIEEEAKTAEIQFIDYGNSESLAFENLKELTIEFMEYQFLCIPVTIPDANESLIGKSIMVGIEFSGDTVNGRILDVNDGETENAAAVVETTAEVKQPEEPTGTDVPVILSHVDSPSDFYLQLAESCGTIETVQATIQEQVSEMSDLENPTIGVLCIAPFSLDQQWYRALVLDADSDITTVRFVDYGNTDVLDNSTTKVKIVPPNLLSLDRYATRCRLKIKPVDEEWSTAANNRFEELTNAETITAKFIDQDEKTDYVELYVNGNNIGEILVKENLAQPDEIIQESQSICFVSHLNSPSEFWIQLENCIDELEWIAEQLSGAESFPELEDLSPGKLCAALFPDDQMWYRARILSNTVAGIELLFIDYGNSCTSCSLRELPEDLIMLSPQAQKCCLVKPENLVNWSPEMCNKFTEISADGQATFTVKKLGTGETTLVELLLNGENVTNMLLPTTEPITVKSFTNFDEFNIEKNGIEVENKFQLEKLPDVDWNEESIQKFMEINKEGSTVFQAEFVSDNILRLYRDLNDIRFDIGGIKKVTPSGSPLKIRADIKERSVGLDLDTLSKDDLEKLEEAQHIESNDEAFVEGMEESSANDIVDPIVKGLCDSVVKTPEIIDNLTASDIVNPIAKSLVDAAVKSPEKTTGLDEDTMAGDIVKPIIRSLADSAVKSPEKTTELDEDTTAGDIVNPIIRSLADSVVKSPEKTTELDNDTTASDIVNPITKSLVDAAVKSPEKTTELDEDTTAGDIVNPIIRSLADSAVKSPEKTNELDNDTTASDIVNPITKSLVDAAVKSPENTTELDEDTTAGDIVNPIIRSLADSAVKSPEKTNQLDNDTTASDIVNPIAKSLVDAAVKSPDKDERHDKTTASDIVNPIIKSLADAAVKSPEKGEQLSVETVESPERVGKSDEIVTPIINDLTDAAVKSPEKLVHSGEKLIEETEKSISDEMVKSLTDAVVKSPEKDQTEIKLIEEAATNQTIVSPVDTGISQEEEVEEHENSTSNNIVDPIIKALADAAVKSPEKNQSGNSIVCDIESKISETKVAETNEKK